MTNKTKIFATFLRLAVMISAFYIAGHAANFLAEQLERSSVDHEMKMLRSHNINVYLTKLGYYE